MQWAFVDNNNIVDNIIMYDGVSQFTPPDGLSLQQINDWVGIGQNINVSEPSYPTPPAPNPNQQQIDSIINQLSALDSYIPRGLEDYWLQTNYNTTLLPQIQQTRLAQKQTLRTQLASLS